MSQRTSTRSRRAPEPSAPDRQLDHGWKARAICVDGPAAGTGISNKVEEGGTVKVRVHVDNEGGGKVERLAIYAHSGETPDGLVALTFSWYEGEAQRQARQSRG